MSTLRLFFSLLLSLPLFLCAAQQPAAQKPSKDAHQAEKVEKSAVKEKPKICLNMIVKDESRVIKRCLDSVKSIIDYWVIVDTGSKDGTQEIIKTHLKEIPGELHERPWVNFEVNRNQALELAQGKRDYILFMDADDLLEFQPEFQWPSFHFDLYNMWRGVKGFTYHKPQLVKAGLPWRWVGVTHEYLDCGQPYTSMVLEKVLYITGDGSASSRDPSKFLKNIRLLEDGLKKEPHNDRYAFYLAESYRDAGEKGKAFECYQKRISMGGWDEEIFWSKLQIAHLLHGMGVPIQIVIEAYKDAHQFRPHRIEPTYYLAAIYNEQRNYNKAYACLKARELIAQPDQKDSLFNHDWIEEYGLAFQLSICSYYLGHYQESLDACDKLRTIADLPKSWAEQNEVNRAFAVDKLKLLPTASQAK